MLIKVLLEILAAIQPIAIIFIGKEVINVLAALIYKNDKQQDLMTLVSLVVILLSLQVFGIILAKINDICTGIYKNIISNFLELKIIDKASSLDISFFDSPKFHNELINARRDSLALQTLVWFSMVIIRACTQVVISITVLIKLHWLFPFMLIALNIPSILVEKSFTRHIYTWARSKVPDERKMGYIKQVLSDKYFAKDVRLFNIKDYLMEKHKSIWGNWFMENNKIILNRGKWSALASILPQFGVMAVTLVIGLKIVYKKLSLGDFSLYTGIVSQLTAGISSLIGATSQIYDNNIKIQNFRKFMSWESNIKEHGDEKPLSFVDLEFKNVSFKYPYSEKLILNNISFKISSEEKIALVGLNGAGKSTIIKLLLRFYDPTDGQILLNGLDIKKYCTQDYYKLFSALFQDFSNYFFSVRESVALSDISGIDDEQRIIEACRISGANQVLDKWVSGLNTFLTKQFDENGEELSGGQWQKMALARTFFRNASFIILDEPSSSLDPEAEHELFDSFCKLVKGKSAIFISHRLSNVTMADRILVLDKGEIIEDGSHSELLSNNGYYAYLFNLQAEKYLSSH